jgi:hypothetical protein
MPQIKQVYDRLSELKGLLEEHKKLVLQERADITGLNLAGLASNRAVMENIFVRIRLLGEQTGTQIKNACDLSGTRGEIGLTPLIAVVPKPDRELFVRLQKSIQTVAAEIENALAVNRALLEDSLAFTDQSLFMFTSMLKHSSTYGQAGRYLESVDRSMLINREI